MIAAHWHGMQTEWGMADNLIDGQYTLHDTFMTKVVSDLGQQ